MMDLFNFNRDHGFLEGLVRGFRTGILSRQDYNNLGQADTLEDLKLGLHTTQYHSYVSNLTSGLSVPSLDKILKEKMVKEFNYLRAHSYDPLSKFLDYISYGYMIDNINLLLLGALHGRPLNELLEKCHPLGLFDRISLITVCSSPSELYQTFLMDTPLGQFFSNCLSENDFDDTNVEIIKNSVYRSYLESFYSFVKEIGGLTEIVMTPLLQFEADRRAISITMNSLNTELNKQERNRFFASFGLLGEEVLSKLVKADDFEQIRQILLSIPFYNDMFRNSDFNNNDDSNIEDTFLSYEVRMHNMTFIHQFNFAVFYSYFKLLETQNRNIIWIAECVIQQNKSKIDQVIKAY